MKKRFLSLALIGTFILTFSSVCYAGEYNFSNKKHSVDSNTWSYVGSAMKDSDTEYAELKITKIYDANGLDSNYTYIYAKATVNGTSTLIKKGDWRQVPIPSDYQKKGKGIMLYCMGHDPKLDCQISGYWNVH